MPLEQSGPKSVEDVLSECELSGSLGMYQDIHDIINLALQGNKNEALAKLDDFIEGAIYPDSIGMGAPTINPGTDPEDDVDQEELANLGKLKTYIQDEL